jgi:hypothetical protein
MSIQLTGSLSVTGSVTASVGFYGKSNGQVTPISVVSNTASLDLQTSNFYTLQLVSGSTIFVNATNIQAGQFSLLEVSTVSQSAITFSDNIIQGSPSYAPTQLSSKDLLSFSSFNSSSAILSELTSNFGQVFPIATGGTITTSGSYKIHTFTSSADFTITNAVSAYPFEYFIVGAGGNAGTRTTSYFGGGGASGTVRTGTTNISTTGSTILPVAVGVTSATRTSTFNSISATGGNNGSNANESGGGAGPGVGGSNSDFSGGGGAGSGGTNGGGGAGSTSSATGGSGDTIGGTGTISTISGASITYANGGNGNGGSNATLFGGGADASGTIGVTNLGKDGIVYIKYQYTS